MSKQSTHRLPTQARNAARQCLEVHYIASAGGVEDAIALCTGLRAALGEDVSATERLFEGDTIRLVSRASGFVHPRLDIRDKAIRAVTELENTCLTPEGADKLWSTLAAAVGDDEPDTSDRRVRDILLLLRGEIEENRFTPKRATRPSIEHLRDTLSVFRGERERYLVEQRARREAEMERVREQHLSSAQQGDGRATETADSSLGLDRQKPLGKIALRILAMLHQGNVAVLRHAYQMPGSQPDDRVTFDIPETEGGERPTFLYDLSGGRIDRHYSVDHLWDLKHAGLIGGVYDFSPDVSCLTPRGIAEATRVFGPPALPLMVRQDNGDPILSEQLEASMHALFNDGHEDRIIADLRMKGRLEWLIECVSEGSSPQSAAASSWLEAHSSAPALS